MQAISRSFHYQEQAMNDVFISKTVYSQTASNCWITLFISHWCSKLFKLSKPIFLNVPCKRDQPKGGPFYQILRGAHRPSTSVPVRHWSQLKIVVWIKDQFSIEILGIIGKNCMGGLRGQMGATAPPPSRWKFSFGAPFLARKVPLILTRMHSFFSDSFWMRRNI